MLVRLLYVSRALDFGKEAVDAIVAQSRSNNPASGVTGILCHGSGNFLQSIEGGREAINSLYGLIIYDVRHTDVMLLRYEEILERSFSSWTMGQVDLSKLNASVTYRFSDKPQLDPYAASGAVVLELLEELVATAAVDRHP